MSWAWLKTALTCMFAQVIDVAGDLKANVEIFDGYGHDARVMAT
jgi:hypothetical protein